MDALQIRPAVPDDSDAILTVHRAAFGQDDKAALVRDLMDDPSAQPIRSMVASQDSRIVGHILFTRIGLRNPDAVASILCPLAVLPDHQGKGAGSALIDSGLATLHKAPCDLVFVLGDPAYYGKFGFQQADVAQFPTPQPIPDHYRPGWMVQTLSSKPSTDWNGPLTCAEALNKPEYWAE